MKVVGTTTMDAPVDKVWEAFLTPEVLVGTIPGCERLEETGENQYLATVTAGVGSIKGSYQGKVRLADLKKHQSLTLHAAAGAATGTIDVEVAVTFTDLGDKTQIDYDADATVGGMIGGVGQRMLTSVSKKMANEFFSNVNKILTGERTLGGQTHSVEKTGADPVVTADGAAPSAAPARVVGAPASSSGGSFDDLFKGFVAGALTALVGVFVGALAARRR